MLKKRYPNTSPPDIQDDETEAPFSLISSYLSACPLFRWTNLSPERELLGSGMMLIKNCITLMGQVFFFSTTMHAMQYSFTCSTLTTQKI
ncbi:hypothetical protein Hanom_Chr06g00478731 [Helianthus anomalus]